MRTIGILLLLPWAGLSDTAQNAPLVRGVVLECDSVATGEVSIRAADNEVLRYQFDRKTYVERDQQLIEAARLKPGEKVEILSDRLSAYPLRYARTIHVLQPVAPPRPQTLGRYRAYNPKAEPVIPASAITYSGVVSNRNDERIVLHTREAGDLSISLRKDTRFLNDGQIVDPDQLKLNMRVFVRAGKDLYGQVEAYQVIWGSIRRVD